MAAPHNVNFEYAVVRCLEDEANQRKAFVDGYASHPQHGWFALAAGYAQAQSAQWAKALTAYAAARLAMPALADGVAVDTARVKRLLQQDRATELTELGKTSESLQQLLNLERGQDLTGTPYKVCSELAAGRLEQALQQAHATPLAESRVLRLVAASDGANAALIARAQALPRPKRPNTGWTVCRPSCVGKDSAHLVIASLEGNAVRTGRQGASADN